MFSSLRRRKSSDDMARLLQSEPRNEARQWTHEEAAAELKLRRTAFYALLGLPAEPKDADLKSVPTSRWSPETHVAATELRRAQARLNLFTASKPREAPELLEWTLADDIALAARTAQATDAFSEAPGFPDLHQAPPNFSVGNKRVVFADIEHSKIDLTFDVAQKKATSRVRISLFQPEAGAPVLDLVPDVTKLIVDGKELPPEAYATVKDPDGTSSLRIVGEGLSAGHHVIEVEYPFTQDVRFDGKGVGFATDMSDLNIRSYMEKYFPASYEYDQHPTTVNIRVEGATRAHRVISNGALTQNEDGSQSVSFPHYFTTSSMFLDVVDPAKVKLKEGFYQGKPEVHGGEAPLIPILIYGTDEIEVNKAFNITKNTLLELEDTYGPYAHASFTACITQSGGGMEYCGATRSSVWALAHEITHSFNARGVMPASGNAGWVDEAWASWRDDGYPRATSVSLSGKFPTLAAFSPYKRDTTQAAYNHGKRVMSELDFLLKDKGGLRPILAAFYKENVRETMTTEMFFKFIQERSPVPLDEFFKVKVYGGKNPPQDIAETEAPGDWMQSG